MPAPPGGRRGPGVYVTVTKGRVSPPALPLTHSRSSRPVERTRSASERSSSALVGFSVEQRLHVLEGAAQLVEPVLQPVELGAGDQDDVAGQPGLRRRRPLLVGPLPARLAAVQPRPADRLLLGQHPAAPAAAPLLAAPRAPAVRDAGRRAHHAGRPLLLCHAAHGRRRHRQIGRTRPERRPS